MKARTTPRAAWALWALIVGLSVATLVLTFLDRAVIDSIDLVPLLSMPIAAVGYGTVGALIGARRQNLIGWIFCTIALGFVLFAFSWAYILRGLLAAPGSLPSIALLAWVRNFVLTFAIAPIPLLLLLFPNGRLPSHRWRVAVWILTVGPLLNLIQLAFTPNPLFEHGNIRIENPIGISGLSEGPWLLFIIPALLWFGTAFSSVVALVQRFRRATGDEKQQLRWLAYVAGTSGALAIPGLVLGAVGFEGRGLGVVSFALFLLGLLIGVPAASAVAILKFRLYDLDVVVKKTVVVGILAVLVSVLYVGVVVGIGSAVTGSRTSPATLLTFVAAALLALLFQPIRRRANHLANRLVYGDRATPYEVLSEFADRMAGSYSTEDVLPLMAKTLAAGTGATRGGVWVRVGAELRLVTAWPLEVGTVVRTLPLSNGELPPAHGASGAFPVRHQGELLGAISVDMAASDPLTPSKEKLIRDVAGQAGLVLRNVRLIEELRASRQRIVSAQDARAKALERNIHDGAQQELVALMVRMRLAAEMADRDPERTKGLLNDLQADAGKALENLRELARGIYPPLLADRGLGDALSAQARRAPVPVTVDADGVGRYPPEAEAAVYFCCLEALQNVAKYAAASRVVIRLSVERGRLVFRVEDDGRGFDTARPPNGSGLQNMADRLAALGGTVEVRSEQGRGTTVVGRIPLESAPPDS